MTRVSIVSQPLLAQATTQRDVVWQIVAVLAKEMTEAFPKGDRCWRGDPVSLRRTPHVCQAEVAGVGKLKGRKRAEGEPLEKRERSQSLRALTCLAWRSGQSPGTTTGLEVKCCGYGFF